MSDVTFAIPVDQRIRLKSDRADVYTFAVGGSEGWVRKRRISQPGDYKMVFVEWDSEHWTYNGEPNIWTYEEHFDIVETEEPMADKNEKDDDPTELDRAFDTIRKALFSGQGRTKATPSLENEPEVESENNTAPHPGDLLHVDPEGYIDAIESALDLASGADAFLVIAVSQEKSPLDPETTMLIPTVISAYQDESSGLLLEAQLSHMAATAHEASNRSLIRKLKRNES